jgi:hypothetical protein
MHSLLPRNILMERRGISNYMRIEKNTERLYYAKTTGKKISGNGT